MAKVSDGIIEGMKFSKVAFIISDKSEELAELIMKEMKRGATGISARGMYSGNQKEILGRRLFFICNHFIGRNSADYIKNLLLTNKKK